MTRLIETLHEEIVAPTGPGNPRNTEGAIIALKDGRLLLGYTRYYGDGADHAPAEIYGRISADGGYTWGTPFLLQANIGQRYVMSVSFLRLLSGDLLMGFMIKHHELDDARYYVRHSPDDGQTWGEPVATMAEPGYFVVCNDRLVQTRGGRIIVPTEPELRTRSGKRVEVQRKVFPGYVLIEMVLDDSTWYLIKSTTGVTGFVTSGNKPVPLQNKEVEDILQAVDGPKMPPRVKWQVNEVVRVVTGPFAEFTGKIEDVNGQKETLKVLISIFGRDTPVELEFSQVERL